MASTSIRNRVFAKKVKGIAWKCNNSSGIYPLAKTRVLTNVESNCFDFCPMRIFTSVF